MVGVLGVSVLVLLSVVVWMGSKLSTSRNALITLREVYAPITDREEACAKLDEQIRSTQGRLQSTTEELRALVHRHQGLVREVSALDEEANLQQIGLYKPRYGFPESGRYEQRLKQVRDQQKQMVKEELAAVCRTEWTVHGSVAEGKKMTRNNIKLMLMAFNGECDAAISKVKYNNLSTMEKRLNKAFDAINKLMAPNQCEITRAYYSLKQEELFLVYEYQEKKQAEREEQQRLKEEMREEAAAQREAERALKDASRDEDRYQKALDRARQELESASFEKQAALQERLAELEQQLIEAHERSQRAKSMAELTRVGHVYVISNVGSFGEHVYKIGMTRRLEPLDRVKELGDASVPFSFDVHAMIYSEDAPALENALHKAFDAYRVNRVNNRKEYFRVSLEEIERVAIAHNPDVEFTHFAEAEEYRKSIATDSEEALAA